MILSPQRIQEIKDKALTNLKKADNSRCDFDKEKFWSLYRADVRELLSAINSLEGKDD